MVIFFKKVARGGTYPYLKRSIAYEPFRSALFVKQHIQVVLGNGI